jgi:hypothetical protein
LIVQVHAVQYESGRSGAADIADVADGGVEITEARTAEPDLVVTVTRESPRIDHDGMSTQVLFEHVVFDGTHQPYSDQRLHDADPGGPVRKCDGGHVNAFTSHRSGRGIHEESAVSARRGAGGPTGGIRRGRHERCCSWQ